MVETAQVEAVYNHFCPKCKRWWGHEACFLTSPDALPAWAANRWCNCCGGALREICIHPIDDSLALVDGIW